MKTIPAKVIVTRNKSTQWFGCDYNMNLYKGCSHGCIYCDSRSACYHIDNFDTVCVKENAMAIVRDNLARYVKTGVVATGAMSDPYNPFEEKHQFTRNALQLLHAYQYGVAIATKSSLITRDIDILQDIKKEAPVLCKITITTAKDELAAKIEPHVSPSSQRFAALEQLANAGIFCGVLLMPVLPFITDTPEEIVAIVEQAAAAGARFIYAGLGVTMRTGQREYFLQKLEQTFPGEGLAKKYQSKYGYRYQCASPKAKQLWQVFSDTCNKYGLLYKMQDIVSAYRSPYYKNQLSFFND